MSERPTMAAVLPAPRAGISVQAVTVADPGPGEVLIKMEACGICHSDLFVARLEKPPLIPLTLGHEGIGRVESLGPGVTSVAAGDRAGITFLASTCGECELCRSGRERYCARQVNSGYTRHGALAGYMLAPAQHLVRIPGGLAPHEAAPLCCAGWTAYAALRETGVGEGQSVAIFGMGGVGHLAFLYALTRKLRVAVVDLAQPKLAMARQMGAQIALEPENAGRLLQKEHGGMHAAIVLTAAPGAIEEAFRSLKRTGVLVLVGLANAQYDLPIVDTVLKGITVRGSYLGTPEDLHAVLRLAAQGVVKPRVETHELSEAPQLLERMRRGELMGRAVITF